MNSREDSRDVVIVLAGAPFQDDSLGLALRTIADLMTRGARVHVWACGFATWLTQAHAPHKKPRGAMDWEQVYPSAAGTISELLTKHAEMLLWTACRTCSEERNLTNRVPEVKMRLATQMRRHFDRAHTVLTVGTT